MVTLENVRDFSPALGCYTDVTLLGQVWNRAGLSPRDRRLVTVSALVAAGHAAQMPFHLNRAMDNGLTQAEAAEVIAHLAFYEGWPRAMSAARVPKDVFEARVK